MICSRCDDRELQVREQNDHQAEQKIQAKPSAHKPQISQPSDDRCKIVKSSPRDESSSQQERSAATASQDKGSLEAEDYFNATNELVIEGFRKKAHIVYQSGDWTVRFACN